MFMIWSCKGLWDIRMRLLIILSSLLYGCSIFKTEQINLYEEFNRLNQEVENNTILPNRKDFFTAEYLKEVDPSNKNSLLLLNLPNYVHQEISHYQKSSDQGGCLSINGVEKNKEPISLHLEYKHENGAWVVNYMFLHFMENSDGYTKEALCPRDAEGMILDNYRLRELETAR